MCGIVQASAFSHKDKGTLARHQGKWPCKHTAVVQASLGAPGDVTPADILTSDFLLGARKE